MFKELFEEELGKVFVGSHEGKKGISLFDLESGEAADFKDMKDLIKSVQDKPRDFMPFYRKTSKQLRIEAKNAGDGYEDSLEPVLIRIPMKFAKQVKI